MSLTLTGPSHVPDPYQVPNKRQRLEPADAPASKAVPQPPPPSVEPRSGIIACHAATSVHASVRGAGSAQHPGNVTSRQPQPQNSELVALSAKRAADYHLAFRGAGTTLQHPLIAGSVATDVGLGEQQAAAPAAAAAATAAGNSSTTDRLEHRVQPAAAGMLGVPGKTTPHSITPRDCVPESPEFNSEDGSPAGPAGQAADAGPGVATAGLPPPTWRIGAGPNSRNQRHVVLNPPALPTEGISTAVGAAAELAAAPGGNQPKRAPLRPAPAASRLSRGSGVQQPQADGAAAAVSGATAG